MNRGAELRRIRGAGLHLVVLGLFLGCSADQEPIAPGPLPPPLPATPFVVSNPVMEVAAPASGTVLRPVGPPDPAAVVYVSLPPGAIPGAMSASIVDRRLGSSAIALTVDGGFDPVPLEAAVGDTLEVLVQVGGTGHPVAYLVLVRAAERPIVVRTSPPEHKRDVPLNATIVVTFSEPMDSASLTQAITLTEGGAQVPGSVTMPPNSGDMLRAAFVPAAPLAPLTTYTLKVSNAARDRSGDMLATAVASEFTTDSLPADTLPPVVAIISPNPGDTVPIDFPRLRIGINSDAGLNAVDLWVANPPDGSPWLDIFGTWGDLAGILGRNMKFNFGFYPPPGTYSIRVEATDAAGKVGTSPSTNLVFVAGDTQPRIVVKSFSVVEYQYSSADNYWFYAPQLVVADETGGLGLKIVGFEMLTIPGLPSGFPKTWAAAPVSVPPNQSQSLFGEVYGDYELSFFAYDGHRSGGGEATARLTYQDLSGHYYATVLRGVIVSGSLPTTYDGGCGHWESYGFQPDYGCPTAVRQAVR